MLSVYLNVRYTFRDAVTETQKRAQLRALQDWMEVKQLWGGGGGE